MTETRTERLTIPARLLRRADRILNLVPGRTVTAFDLTIGDDAVDVFPAFADLEAGVERRLTIAAGESVVVDREVLAAGGAPVHPAVVAPTPVVEVAAVPVEAARQVAEAIAFQLEAGAVDVETAAAAAASELAEHLVAVHRWSPVAARQAALGVTADVLAALELLAD